MGIEGIGYTPIFSCTSHNQRFCADFCGYRRYLRVELENRIYEARYREVFIAFQEKLSHTLVSNGSIISTTQVPLPGSTMSLWQLLVEQERFVSGILKCQKDSLDARGKKDAKEKYLREALEAGGFRNIPRAVPLPSAPHIWVKGINCKSAKMFKSALYPAVLDFVVAPHPESSKQSKEDLRPIYKVMIKSGDDLRQDQLVIMMIQLMERLLKRGTLDLWCVSRNPFPMTRLPNPHYDTFHLCIHQFKTIFHFGNAKQHWIDRICRAQHSCEPNTVQSQ